MFFTSSPKPVTGLSEWQDYGEVVGYNGCTDQCGRTKREVTCTDDSFRHTTVREGLLTGSSCIYDDNIGYALQYSFEVPLILEVVVARSAISRSA